MIVKCCFEVYRGGHSQKTLRLSACNRFATALSVHLDTECNRLFADSRFDLKVYVSYLFYMSYFPYIDLARLMERTTNLGIIFS